jgi:hypothetical protein
MKPQELRIGNIVEQGEIKNFWEKGVHVGFGKCFEFNELKPIPLTEDLVKKTNLENRNGGYFFKDTHLYLDFSLGRCMLCHFSGDSFRELKYLCELQNIYFCLMEEELIINI